MAAARRRGGRSGRATRAEERDRGAARAPGRAAKAAGRGEEARGARSAPQSVNRSLGRSAVTHPCGGWGGGERSRSGTPPPPVAAGLSRPLARRDRPFHSGQGTLRCAAAAAERKHARTHARTHERTHARTARTARSGCDAATPRRCGAVPDWRARRRGGSTLAFCACAPSRAYRSPSPALHPHSPLLREARSRGSLETEGGVVGALCACAALTGGRWKPRWGGRAGCRRRAGAVLGGRAASGVRVRRDEAGGSSAAAAR